MLHGGGGGGVVGGWGGGVRFVNVNVDTRMEHVQMSMHVNNREIGSQNRVEMVNVALSLIEF